MRTFLRVFRAGLMIGRQDFTIFWNWKTWLGGWLLRTLFTAATWTLLGKALGSVGQLQFILIGMAVILGTTAVGWTVPAATWDRMDGIYPLQVVAPTSLVPMIMGRTSIWLLNGFATAMITLVILAAIFGFAISAMNLLLAPLMIALIGASYYFFALFLGSLTIRIPQLRNVVHNLALALVMTLCCVTVPLNFWPAPVVRIAKAIPITHGLISVRLLFSHGSPASILRGAAVEALVAVVWLSLAIMTMDRMANYGRSDGSIEQSDHRDTN